MDKLKREDVCISRIDTMKPVNIELVNLLINNNNNDYLLIRKRMFENIRQGLIKEALFDAEMLSRETPTIESKLIAARLYLCLGDTIKVLKELNMCIECSESCSRLLGITKIDAAFIDGLVNNSDNLDIVRQDYVIQSLTNSNEEYLWVDFMPYIISLLNYNRSEAEDWLNVLTINGNKTTKKLSEELLNGKFNLFNSKNEYKGLYYFLKWLGEKDIRELEKVVECTYFPDSIYIFARILLNKS